MKHRVLIAIAVAVAVGQLALTWPQLGAVMTVDEENWMLRSADFWHQLFREGNPGGTFMTTHPGASLMWIAGGGIFVQEARLGYDIAPDILGPFRVAATMPVAVTNAVLAAAVVFLAGLLLSVLAAVAIGIVLVSEPYISGMAQIVHLDALLAYAMTIALLSVLLAVRTAATKYWVLAGVAAGLALATKLLPALWVFVAIGGILLWSYRSNWRHIIRRAGIVGGFAISVLWILWPALWVKDDVARSFEKDVPTIVTDQHVALEVADEPIQPATFYVRTALSRITPAVYLGLVLAAVLGTRRRKAHAMSTGVWFVLSSVGFLVLVTLVAKKADRYALPALLGFALVAGWGLSLGWDWTKAYLRNRFLRAVIIIVPMFLLGLQFISWAPHGLAYSNPLVPNVRPLSQQGWGEGLERAAAWLNSRPGAENIIVASWYQGVMKTYFQGETWRLSSRDDARVNYVVTYRNMGGRANDSIASDVLDEVQAETPVHTVEIGGVPYVFIYDRYSPTNFPEHIGELAGVVEVGQTVYPPAGQWSRIDIGFSTFSSRRNTEDVLVQIYSSPEAEEPLREISLRAATIVDNEWQAVVFDPIEVGTGDQYYVALTSPSSVAGNAVTVRFSQDDVREGQMYLLRQGLRNEAARAQYVREGDIAYRIPQYQ